MLKLVSKPKATQSAFITLKIIFNEKKVLNILDTSNVIETEAAIIEKPKTFSKKNKKQKNENND